MKEVLFFIITGSINVHRPIRHGIRLMVPGHGEVWGTLRYERLPFFVVFFFFFFVWCRSIGHNSVKKLWKPKRGGEEEPILWEVASSRHKKLHSLCISSMKVDIE